MLSTTVTARELQRNQKRVLEHIVLTKQPAVVLNEKVPQVVIVPLEEYERIRQHKRNDALKRLRNLSQQIAEEMKDPPPFDMAKNHDTYMAEALKNDLKRTQKKI